MYDIEINFDMIVLIWYEVQVNEEVMWWRIPLEPVISTV